MNKLNVKLVSDIHLKPSYQPNWREVIDDSNCDYLILAGDTCRIEKTVILVKFLTELCTESSFKKILYVCGNHEYYNRSGIAAIKLLALLREKTQSLEKLLILDNDTFDLGNNIRIFGGTMWYSSAPTHQAALIIYDEFGYPVTRNWLQREHHAFLHRLDVEINRARTDRKRLLVVSHYPPLYHTGDTVAPQGEIHPYLTKEHVYIWMYGHTHINVDFRTPLDTRIVTNQRAGRGFEKGKVLQLKDFCPY